MEEYRIFYSWQSDLPNSTNRSFIEKALENAAKVIRSDDSIRVEPVIDRDTSGVPGAPDIANTIFTKIDQAQVFACDVSIINQGEKSRKTPNPNVLIELGYAIKTLGTERILMIMNTAFSPPEILPFDLSKKRVVTYCMPKECKDRATERKALTSKLEEALRTILSQIEAQQPKASPVSLLKEYLVDDRYRIQLDELVNNETEQLSSYLDVIDTTPTVISNESSYVSLIRDFEERVTTLRDFIIIGCTYGEAKHNKIWQKILQQIANPTGTNILPEKRYPALILLYAAGITALRASKFDTLNSLLRDTNYIIGQDKLPLVLYLSAWDASERSNIAAGLPNEKDTNTPVSNHLAKILEEPLSQIVPDSVYQEYFDRFEYFLALVRTDTANKVPASDVNVAIGRFALRRMVDKRRNGSTEKFGIVADIESEAKKDQNNWGPLKAGFFDGSIDRFLHIKDELDGQIEKLYYLFRSR